MKLPEKTSRILELQEKLGAELRLRLGEIFKRYRALAFSGRNDNLFAEHWTPEQAASGYDFESYEIKGEEMVLHGVENAGGFVYRISISFPIRLIDDLRQIDEYLTQHYAGARAGISVPCAEADPPPAL